MLVINIKSFTVVLWLVTLTDKEKQAARILQLLADDEYDYHVLPHHGLIPDWRLRYRDLRKAVLEYFSEGS